MRHLTPTRCLLTTLCALSLPLSATAARPPAAYYAEANGNTVVICPQLRNDRACPQPEGMLRQEIRSGAVVRLPQHCTNRRVKPKNVVRETNRNACYIDECVPPGTYRYGYANPLACVGSTTYYFAEVSVTQELAKDCRRSGGAKPSPVKRVPWGESPYVCVGGCGCDLANLPDVSWGLILLLIAGTSSFLIYRHGRQRS